MSRSALRLLGARVAPPCRTLCAAALHPHSRDAHAADEPHAPPPPPPPPPRRPDLSPLAHGSSARRAAIDRMLRVDHAGETGAVHIYAGQLSVLGGTGDAATLEEMGSHERAHLARFNELLPRHRTRPSALLPLWRAAGYALGAGSAALGREAAYAVTEAVESAITEHYDAQLRELHSLGGDGEEEELRGVFRSFRDEEQAHLDEAVRQDAHLAPAYGLIKAAIKAGCGAAIWLTHRV